MSNPFKRKSIALTVLGAEIVASAYTHGKAGGSIYETTAWIYEFN